MGRGSPLRTILRKIPLWGWIAILGILDVLITYWGLINGWIVEANPLMAFLFQQELLWGVVYALFANVVLVYLIDTAKASFWWVTPTLQLLLVVKISALVLHLIWIRGVFW